MKLVIGGAQFGLDYGVSNKTGKINPDEAECILSTSKKNGIDTIDAAVAYGDCEEALGKIGLSGWRVGSKVPPGVEGKDSVVRYVHQSLQKLKVDTLDYCLVHLDSDLLGPNGKSIAAGMMQVKNDGLAKKIGYAIYSPDPLTRLIEVLPPDIIQTPLNVFDHRIVSTGWLEKLVQSRVEVHARSLFLQGLLLLSPDQRAKYGFNKSINLWKTWDSLVGGSMEKALSLCLGFAKAHPALSKVVIGVENCRNLEQLINLWGQAVPFDANQLSCNDLLLLEPQNWKKI